MFGFPVSVMILVMIVFGGIGSVWGVVLGAFILQLLQSWWLQDLSEWLHALGRLVDSSMLQHIDLVPSIELIFGLILVCMMLRGGGVCRQGGLAALQARGLLGSPPNRKTGTNWETTICRQATRPFRL